MRQRVNLSSNIPKPPRYFLNEKLTVQIVVGFALLLAIISVIQFSILQYRSHQVSVLQKSLVKKSKALDALMAQKKSQQVVSLKEEIALKTNIIAMLHPATPASCTFSAYLRSLASGKIAGLWLSSIRIVFDKPEITLKGMTVEPALVMVWLHALASTPCFPHQPFNTIELSHAQTVAQAASTPVQTNPPPSPAPVTNKPLVVPTIPAMEFMVSSTQLFKSTTGSSP